MKIVVIGGTGLIGSRLVQKLVANGHEVVPAARSTGVDVATGAGLSDALEGAEVVVDLSNSGYSDAVRMQHFVREAGPNLLAAELKAQVRHHILLSIIGSDRLKSGFFLAKKEQEEMVANSELPFTIVRSAPFFEYIYNIVDAGGDGDVIRVPPVRMQPIAADDVARALANVVQGKPLNAIIELVGPDTLRLPILAQEILTANEDPRTVITDRDAPYFGARMEDEPLIGGSHPRFASTSFDDWLRKSLIPA